MRCTRHSGIVDGSVDKDATPAGLSQTFPATQANAKSVGALAEEESAGNRKAKCSVNQADTPSQPQSTPADVESQNNKNAS